MPFVKPHKSFILKILTQQHVLFNILCDTTEVQGKEHIFCSLAMAVLRKSTCMTELWANLDFFFFFEGAGASFFFLGKTDRQTMVIQTWRSGLFSKMKEVKLSRQEKLTVFVASGKIWPFKSKLSFGKLVSGIWSFTAFQFLTLFLETRFGINHWDFLVVGNTVCCHEECCHWCELLNQYFQMTKALKEAFKKDFKWKKKDFKCNGVWIHWCGFRAYIATFIKKNTPNSLKRLFQYSFLYN